MNKCEFERFNGDYVKAAATLKEHLQLTATIDADECVPLVFSDSKRNFEDFDVDALPEVKFRRTSEYMDY